MTDVESTESTDGKQTDLDRARQVYEGAQRRVRRTLNVLLFGLGFVIFVPMVIGAVTGVQDEQIWDPLTGMPVALDEDLHCANEAGDLLFLAGVYREYEGRWEQRFRRWRTLCQDEEPELQMLLSHTRDRLRGEKDLPDLQVEPEDE